MFHKPAVLRFSQILIVEKNILLQEKLLRDAAIAVHFDEPTATVAVDNAMVAVGDELRGARVAAMGCTSFVLTIHLTLRKNYPRKSRNIALNDLNNFGSVA